MTTTVWDLGYGYWAHSGERVYQLNVNPWRPQVRIFQAIAIRSKPWYHRKLYFSCITGEQVQYEVVQSLRKSKCSPGS